MKNTILAAAASLMMLPPAFAAAAQADQTPIITFRTNLYAQSGESNAFHFYIGASEDIYVDVDFGFGPMEAEVSQAVFDPEASGIQGSMISGSVSSEGIVKVYGDASKIDYLDLEGLYITELDIAALTNLQILVVKHNELAALDLTPQSALQSLDVTDNPFGTSPLVVGPKPDLLILTMENIGALDQNFTLTDYPALLSFDAYHTPALKTCDPTQCPGLMRLSLDITDVAALDVTQNPNLLILNISQTKITSIDLSQNPYLTEFYAGHTGSYNDVWRLSTLDLSANPELVRLSLDSNNLTSLDLSACPKLQWVNVAKNYLTSFDIASNPDLNLVDVSNNDLDFATLPAPRVNFTEYYYFQRPMPVARSFAENSQLDLSARVLRPGSETYARILTKATDDTGAHTELSEDYYSYADGVVTFLKSYPDSVYLDFANTELPDYDLTTSNFVIKTAEDFGQDNLTVTMRLKPSQKTVSMKVGIDGASPEVPKSFSVDLGDGNPVTYTATSASTPLVATFTADKKKMGNISLYLPEGSDLTALAIEDVQLTNINLDKAPMLRELTVSGCGLSAISLGYNRCLTSLNLDNNSLAALDLTGVDYNNGKNVLTHISAANNRLASVQLSDGRTPLELNFSNNLLTAFDLENATRLTRLDLSANAIAELDLAPCESLIWLNVASNNLSGLDIPAEVPLKTLMLENNSIALTALPLPGTLEAYTYAPQRPWPLPAKAPTMNLTSQWLDDANGTTAFTWHTVADGRTVTDAEISGNRGVFQVVDPSVGLVYCTWTHPTFPDFNGTDAYRSTDIEAAPMPDIVLASFTTKTETEAELSIASSKAGASVYVDWAGNGALEQCVLADTYTRFYGTTSAGGTAKVLAYTENEGLTVFSLSAGELEAVDASALTSLKSFGCTGAGLTIDKIGLPDADLSELSLGGNALTEANFSRYPNLTRLEASRNALTSFDAGQYPELGGLYLSANKLTSVTFNNPKLWDCYLEANQLESLDLSGAPAMEQLFLTSNRFATLDIPSNVNLRVLAVSDNLFTFATLPRLVDQLVMYEYKNQALLDVAPVGATVDLSAQADVAGNATRYRWFIDSPYYDEYDELTGEELVEGEEFTVDNGVVTFHADFSHIMCVMTNAAFPDMLLLTNFIDVSATGIADVAADTDTRIAARRGAIEISGTAGLPYTVVTPSGAVVAAGTLGTDGRASLSPAHGAYIVRCGAATAKILI